MHRRTILKLLGAGLAIGSIPGSSLRADEERSQVAITIDDPTPVATPLLSWSERDEKIRAALRGHSGLKGALFVCGERVEGAEGKSILAAWNGEGHILANHSYSHLYYHSARITPEEYIADIERGEKVISGYSGFRKLFRYPFLKEGNTARKRDAVRAYLKEQGYTVGHVTIDASDWYIDDRLRKRLEADPTADVAPYRQYFLEHIWNRASYYDTIARELLGRPVRHTLLLHHNLLNALFLGDLLGMFAAKGWGLIDAGDAFADPLFASAPAIIPAGESIIWGLAKESRGFNDRLRYPAEDSRYEQEGMDARGL